MLKFKAYSNGTTWPTSKVNILEAKKAPSQAASSEVDSDDKGKLNELLLAKYLHPKQRLPDHHRSLSENDDHAGSPQQVHDRLRKKIGERAYKEIDGHARTLASQQISFLEKEGHIGGKKGHRIGKVYWTSNRDTEGSMGDHEKTTGVKDVNSNADLILTLHGKDGKVAGFHGISAKYGTEAKPNYKNPGMDSLEQMAGMPSGSISKMLDGHKKNMERIGYDGSIADRHIKYKIDTMGIDEAREQKKELDDLVSTGMKLSASKRSMHSHVSAFVDAHDNHPDPEAFLQGAKDRANEAEVSARTSRAEIAKELSRNLARTAKKHPEGADGYLRNLVRDSVSPNTSIPHSIAHAWVQSDGSAIPKVHSSESVADDWLNNFHGLHVDMDKAGGSITIKGTHKTTGKKTNVATIGLKSQSGPHKGLNGTFKLQ